MDSRQWYVSFPMPIYCNVISIELFVFCSYFWLHTNEFLIHTPTRSISSGRKVEIQLIDLVREVEWQKSCSVNVIKMIVSRNFCHTIIAIKFDILQIVWNLSIWFEAISIRLDSTTPTTTKKAHYTNKRVIVFLEFYEQSARATITLSIEISYFKCFQIWFR